MKKVKQTILYLVAFAVALFLLMVVINLPIFDEELLPEVKAIQNTKAKPFSENNAYIGMWAFGSTREEPFNQITNELIELLNEKVRTSGIDYLTKDEIQKHLGVISTRSWVSKNTDCNSRRDATCMQQYIDQLSNKNIEDKRLLMLLDRYEKLNKYSEYQEAIEMDFKEHHFMGYGTVLDTKKIYLAQAYHQQAAEEFAQTVLNDLAFWRMILKNSHSMISKMIANTATRDTLQAMSVLIKGQKLNEAELTRLQSQLKTLSSIELDMSRTFEFELKYGMNMLDYAAEQEPIGWTKMINFFQKQATHNLNHKYVTQPLIKLSKLDSKALYKKVNSDFADLESPVSWSPAMIYNPTGKLMTGYSIPAYSHYLGRVHDLGGMIHMLKLQIEITLNPTQKTEQVIQSSQYTNPYTGEPFKFNKDNNSIHFKCLEPHSTCELLL